MKSKLLFYILTLLLPASAIANICGTDYQNFNPTTNGLDFVTVQSSETLKPCIMNMGLFFNYAANSLTYSKTFNTGFAGGQKSHDRTLAADLSLGMGLTDRWDIGINVPVILSQSVEDDYYVSSYDETGLTEFKINSKYHLWGDDSRGVAAIVSMNKNLIEDNPFVGRGAGPTWNFEMAADTTLSSQWAIGVNAGYRWRDEGTAVGDSLFVPMGDQWIYSVAGSYLVSKLDTKVIAEIYGSRSAEGSRQDTDRSMNSLEGLLGVKYDATTSMAVHAGAATQLDTSLGGPDWRVYVGLNWALGVGCKTPSVTPSDVATSTEPKVEEFKMDVELLFAWNSDEIDKTNFEQMDSFFREVFHRPFKRLVVEGHTDSVGVEVYNLDLSQRRANHVKDYFIEKYKLNANTIEAIGYGQARPVADNGNFQGRKKNRRVELKIER